MTPSNKRQGATPNPVALQLYTVRELTAKDFAGAVRQVAEAGYGAVEFAGYGGLTAPEMERLLADNGLVSAGTHVGLESLETMLDDVAAYAANVGTRNLIIGGAPPEYRDSADGWRRFADRIEAVGDVCRSMGFTLCYHNHAFEFECFDGQTGYDILFDNTSPDLVQAEVDTFWVKYAGHDPEAVIRKLAGRVPLVHLKDQSKADPKRDTEVGEGTLDFRRIIDVAVEGGAQWLVVEQEDFDRPVVDCIRTSIENLRKMGAA